MVSNWDDSYCWFCKKRKASDSSKYEVDLFRIIDRKSTFFGMGIQYKQSYENTKTWVPRCKFCNKIHNYVSMIFLVFWLILGSIITIWYFKQPDKRADSILINIFGGGIAIVMIFFMCAVSIGFIFMVTNIFWNSEDEADKHPRVKALANENWQIGDKPTYKWEGPD